MKVRTSVARVSGRAMRTAAARRRLALCWPRAAKAMVRRVSRASHVHRHAHALQVNVRLTLGDRAQAPALARVPANAFYASTILRETTSHRATLRELRTMLATQTRASHDVQPVVERHSEHVVRTSTIASRVQAAALIAPKLTGLHRERRTTRPAPLATTTITRAAAHTPDIARPVRTQPATAPSTHTTSRELVWRSPDPARDIEQTMAASTHSIAQAVAQRSSSPQPAPAEVASIVAAQVRKAHAVFTAPEGPALDRLANEVMRRVEKSLRIERERRGR